MRRFGGKSREATRLRTASLLAIGVGLALTVWFLLAAPLDSIQRLFSDALFDGEQGSPNIVIVSIDDAALERHGRLSEWPRSLHQTAIENLHQAGAKVIAYDVLFADRAEGDEALAAAISQAGNVVLPVAGTEPLAREGRSSLVYGAFLLPAPPIRSAAATLAHANLITDGDGTVRRVPLAIEASTGEEYAALSVASLYLQLGLEPPASLARSGGRLHLPGREVPLEGLSTMRINYVGGQESFTVIPFDDLIGGNFDQSLVRNKVVLVGLIATGADVHSTPLMGTATGVEIHANALDTLLRGRFLRNVPEAFTVATVLLFVALGGIALPRWRLGYSIASVVMVVVGYLALGTFIFREGYIVDLVDPPAVLAVVTVVGLVYRAVAERASHQELLELFGRYVSPEIAQELVRRADRGELHLGGELREVTTLFADLRGFTTLAGRLVPSQLVELVNRSFEVIITHVMRNGGIVNKFAGDAVMALWNAPQEQKEHALLACRTAVAAQQELESLARSGPEAIAARFGFGINTGVAVAGNVGTAGRLEYTVLGECVNLASRLSQAAAAGEVWIGEGTYQLICGHMAVEELPPQHLKGIEGVVTVYRLKPAVAQDMGVPLSR